MARAFIGIGSNEGDRLAHISKAIQVLGSLRSTRVVQMAMIAETEPVGGPPQGSYLNTVVELETGLAPLELLGALKDIEQQLGRAPSDVRWGPRPMDLDVLLYDDQVIREPRLCVPHPRMHERRFVLEPLVQLAPELIHPTLHLRMSELLARLPADPSAVTSP